MTIIMKVNVETFMLQDSSLTHLHFLSFIHLFLFYLLQVFIKISHFHLVLLFIFDVSSATSHFHMVSYVVIYLLLFKFWKRFPTSFIWYIYTLLRDILSITIKPFTDSRLKEVLHYCKHSWNHSWAIWTSFSNVDLFKKHFQNPAFWLALRCPVTHNVKMVQVN